MAVSHIKRFSSIKQHQTTSIRQCAASVFRAAAALLFSSLTMHWAWAADNTPGSNAIPGNETIVTPGNTAEEKMKALIEAGVFSGGADNPELSENMTRAQFAKIAALIMGLESDNGGTSNIDGQSFTDIDYSMFDAVLLNAITGAIDDGGPLLGPDSDISDLNKFENVYTAISDISDLNEIENDYTAIVMQGIGENGTDWATQFVDSLVDAGLFSKTGNEIRINELVEQVITNPSSSAPLTVTPKANWPTALNATYVGTISGALTNATPVTGSLAMNVDFANIESMVPNIPGNIVFDDGKGNATFNLVQMGGYIGNSMSGTYNGEAMNGFIRDGQFYGPAANVVKGDWDMTTQSMSGSGQFSAAR